MKIEKIFKKLGITGVKTKKSGALEISSPIDGNIIAYVKKDSKASAENKIKKSEKAFLSWRDVPAPRRGELIRIFGEELRKNKEPLARLVTIECGKILEEGRGEVQEMIDICDFAVGLSRQLYGLTIASERPEHTMQENWLPLGTVGVISAFNFPVAVWAWNFVLAVICGDSVIWKPSEKTPLCALACVNIFKKAAKAFGKSAPDGLCEVVVGGPDIGEKIVNDSRIPLISATGSCHMGNIVGPKVASRFGRSLLELGGNNAIIVSNKADIDLAVQSILFGAVGTAGQRCTSTRRVFVHNDIYEEVFEKLKESYQKIVKTKIGNPLSDGTLVGPLIDKRAFDDMQSSLKDATEHGGVVFFGQRVIIGRNENAYYAQPALVKIKKQTKIVCQETFAPILYVMPYHTLDEAIKYNNEVMQGLSSAIFTTDVREAEYFKKYSDCGIANVNIGTSGAEIGGAFGGEKETGGGRESGSDSWKNYMRRQTSTTYFGAEKPALAQGIKFDT